MLSSRYAVGICVFVITVLGHAIALDAASGKGIPEPAPDEAKISFNGITRNTATKTDLGALGVGTSGEGGSSASVNLGTSRGTGATTGSGTANIDGNAKSKSTNLSWPPVYWRPPTTEVDNGKDEGVDMIVDIISKLAAKGVTEKGPDGGGKDGPDSSKDDMKIGMDVGTGMFDKLNSKDVANAIRSSVAKQINTTKKAVSLFRGIVNDLFGDIIPAEGDMKPREVVEMLLQTLKKKETAPNDVKELQVKVLGMLAGRVRDSPNVMVGNMVTGIKKTYSFLLGIVDSVITALGVTIQGRPTHVLLDLLLKYVYQLNSTSTVSHDVLAGRLIEAVFDEGSPCRALLNELISDIVQAFSLNHNTTTPEILGEIQKPLAKVPKSDMRMFIKTLLDNCGGLNGTIFNVLRAATSILKGEFTDGKISPKCDLSLLLTEVRGMVKDLNTDEKNTTLYAVQTVIKVFEGKMRNRPLETAIVKFVTAITHAERNTSKVYDFGTRELKIKFAVEKSVEAVLNENSLQRKFLEKVLGYMVKDFGFSQTTDAAVNGLNLLKNSFGTLTNQISVFNYFSDLMTNCTSLTAILYRTAESLGLKSVTRVENDVGNCDISVLTSGLKVVSSKLDAKGQSDMNAFIANVTNILTGHIRAEDRAVAKNVQNFLKMFTEASDSLALFAHVIKAVDDWPNGPDVIADLLSILSAGMDDPKFTTLRLAVNCFIDLEARESIQGLHFVSHFINSTEDTFLAAGVVSGLSGPDNANLPPGFVSFLRALGPEDGDTLRLFMNNISQIIDPKAAQLMFKVLGMLFDKDPNLKDRLLREAMAMMYRLPGDNSVMTRKLFDVFAESSGNCTESGMGNFEGGKGTEVMKQCTKVSEIRAGEMAFEKMLGLLFGSDNNVIKHLSRVLKKKEGDI